MANSLNITRQKLDPTVALSVSTTPGTVTETGTTAQSEYFLPIKLENIDPASFTVAGCVTATNTALTTVTSNGFANVNVGDVVTGSGIDTDTVVQTKTSNTVLVLSKATTASASGLTITFDPPSIDPTLYGVFVRASVAGSIVTITAIGHKYSGSLGDTTGTAGNSSSSKTLGSDTINLDTFLGTCRLARTNS